ncbi:MFS transporter [Paraburkholderia caribensis]|uniref:MFS transporter n=1 Tax=Paraburkholderia caribensis TaxID=75105 RepID=UPI0018D29EE5|nr:MFS transporter [Paraburkholderia caribensis]
MDNTSTAPHGVRGAIPMMAAACGVTVANVYLCQPLLSAVATSFHASASTAGLVATGAQVGYATGILLVVPMADRADPRRLIRVLLALTCAALICAGLSPSVHLLALLTLLVTTVTVVPQVLIPVAVSLAAPGKSGRVVGTMQTGLILGILLSRTVSGAVGQFSGSWRASYFLAAALTGLLLIVLPRYIPERQTESAADKKSYLSLLASLPQLVLEWRDLRFSSALGASMFGAFSAFWATLAFHLAQPPFGFGSAQAGLFGLWGATGALIAPQCGRLSDRFGPTAVNIISLCSGALAFAAFVAGGDISIFALVVGVNLLDFGNQAGQIANQARIFKLDPGARARLNTVYMVFTFAGGALGSAIGAGAWTAGGWNGVCVTGFALLALVACLLIARNLFKGKPVATTR